MLNILVNAYAVSPTWGSEPGMGWNWVSNLARYCNLHIITEGEWQKEIEEATKKHPFGENMHFYYIPVSKKIREMCWNQGDWRFYIYYEKWQRKAFEKAKVICEKEQIDIVHQLNMICFREPGYLWKLDKPFVWGPLGGMGGFPLNYVKGVSFKYKVFFRIKSLISMLQLKYMSRVDKAAKKADLIIAAVPSAKQKIKRIKHRDALLINETGCYKQTVEIADKRERNRFSILWVAKFDFRKQLDIALRTIARLKQLPGIEFNIVGTGSEEQQSEYKALAHTLGIDNLCVWHGKVDNLKVHEMMRDADLFFFTSVAEATSRVIPEAINNCLPIVCFNACGFGPLVTPEIGRTVKLTEPEKSIEDFATHINYLYHHKDLLYEMSINCKEAIKGLLWENKAKLVYDNFLEIVEKHHS